MQWAEYQKGRSYLLRLPFGSDILEEIEAFAAKNNIRAASVFAIGACQKAATGFFNQVTRTYEEHSWDEPLEILSCMGTISLKEDCPMAHLHVTFSDSRGMCCGGHLLKGSIVFACEVRIEELEGPAAIRERDPQTDLTLWKFRK